jgi:hypothetical protein
LADDDSGKDGNLDACVVCFYDELIMHARFVFAYRNITTFPIFVALIPSISYRRVLSVTHFNEISIESRKVENELLFEKDPRGGDDDGFLLLANDGVPPQAFSPKYTAHQYSIEHGFRGYDEESISK